VTDKITWLFILLLALAVSACSQPKDPVFHDQFFAFGTLIDITLYGVEPGIAETISSQIESDFNALHTEWHAWQPGPILSLNEKLAQHRPATVKPGIIHLLAEANRLSLASEGLFNPVIGNLIELWGFHDNALPIGTLPDSAAIESLVAENPAVDDITIEADRVVTRNAVVAYDLGGFAKGLAIDRAIERLRNSGIEHAIINAGGDLRAIGQRGERPWRIGIRHPREPGILASIEITGDDSVFTSGDYERFFEVDGKRYHHIIDPRSGYPASETTSVTVIHSDAATADAAATALFVAGPDHWQKAAKNMGIRFVMLIDSQGIIHMNPAMQSRIQLDPKLDATVILGDPLQ
jgi:thiamine biosynthesis lipoprotein